MPQTTRSFRSASVADRKSDPLINVDSKALYVMDTANWQDTIILNGGVRYDGYDLRSSNNTASAKVNSDFINYNVGAVFKPLPIGSIYAAYATSTNPFGQSSTVLPRLWWGSSKGPAMVPSATGRQIGTERGLFDRHSGDRRAFHTERILRAKR
jgi:catecholate siderophore receptor